jgi:hypothetical protein
LLIVRFDF